MNTKDFIEACESMMITPDDLACEGSISKALHDVKNNAIVKKLKLKVQPERANKFINEVKKLNTSTQDAPNNGHDASYVITNLKDLIKQFEGIDAKFEDKNGIVWDKDFPEINRIKLSYKEAAMAAKKYAKCIDDKEGKASEINRLADDLLSRLRYLKAE